MGVKCPVQEHNTVIKKILAGEARENIVVAVVPVFTSLLFVPGLYKNMFCFSFFFLLFPLGENSSRLFQRTLSTN